MAKSPVKLKGKKSPVKVKTEKLVNHVAFILDRSGSMASVRDEVVRVFNAQVQAIRENNKKENQETKVSLVTFNSEVDEAVFFDEKIDQLNELDSDSYRPDGGTSLFDAIGQTFDSLNALPYANKKNTSFLIYIITDGEENTSKKWDAFRIGQYINKLNGTDRWTVTFLAPPNSPAAYFDRLYIAPGNVQRWERSREGIQHMTRTLSASVGNYYAGRSAGHTSFKALLATPDLSKVTRDEVREKLDNVTSQFDVLRVQRVQDIKTFVEEQGHTYLPGRAFYQLTKPEEVQPYKAFCLRDNSDRIYSGNEEARELMKLPKGGKTVKLNPGYDKRFSFFVQSTSFNRKLMPGTDVLYKKK